MKTLKKRLEDIEQRQSGSGLYVAYDDQAAANRSDLVQAHGWWWPAGKVPPDLGHGRIVYVVSRNESID